MKNYNLFFIYVFDIFTFENKKSPEKNIKSTQEKEVINMVTQICDFLVDKMKAKMPDIDDERAEVIHYGLENIVGELPKVFLLFFTAGVLQILDLTFISFLSILFYRAFSGGFHAKTHLACILLTHILYIGNVLLSKLFMFEQEWIKYIIVLAVWIFSVVMISWYAPADTENVPILRKKDRKQKKILSYITMTLTLIMALIIQDRLISNIIWMGVLLQTCCITRLAYKIMKNRYGYEVYAEENKSC